MKICSQRPPAARGGQWRAMHRASKKSKGAIGLLEKAFLETSEETCVWFLVAGPKGKPKGKFLSCQDASESKKICSQDIFFTDLTQQS
ncbi:hypothetical protein llap_13982 [Limosa lapponica baueri]|uniref:Uncharacterized protein n=1 Tax=Limosa lapponica baueri TaxID=1758121 RepID=A0A2I0TPH5_LIMLA|nr:hypothetical protein llap_13982 [Limosa lapponica baueri]